ncbi:Cu(I)-responsive transcriptional regulator [Jannaschia aquimarina]|uniref:Cu(I)-responsive transcriptional regulator n=1 Tax=Jannaschia aquimarina TaxID=935700 RepID=UPI0005C6E8D3|nr:Cu(I)-responsive transcriptional regulator [Jannaschia aquimarina]
MNIGKVAERSGVPAKTIRYYEDIDLVVPIRAANGYRAFRESDVQKLIFVGRARSLGFSIEDCRALLALWEDDARPSAEVKAIASEHLSQIDARIRDLHAMRETLGALVEACAGDERPDCPILKAMAPDGVPEA